VTNLGFSVFSRTASVAARDSARVATVSRMKKSRGPIALTCSHKPPRAVQARVSERFMK
jgi:hypothetical protein